MVEKEITCTYCGKKFEDSIYYRQCSNCFACTGCEIYTCPHCGATVVIKPIKPMNRRNQPLDSNEPYSED